MPPRAKGRRSQAKPDLASAQRNSPRLPQELIDAIIDHFDTSLTDQYDCPDRKALRCCALVARALVRPSQMKLFSTVDLRSIYMDQSPDDRPRLFSKLLTSRPHVGHYVKNLFLAYRCARSNSLDRILSYLPKLTSISLHPWHKFYLLEPFPEYHRDSFLAAFSLSSLRRLSLRDHVLNDALELQSLLSNSLGLEELVLHGIQFANTSSLDPKNHPESPRVVLRSLAFHGMPTRCMEAVLNSLTIVDIRHLRSLRCDRYHEPLILANARSMQELTLIADYDLAHFYPDTLLLPEGLHNLNLQIDSCYTHSLFIRRLQNFATVKTLSITMPVKFFSAKEDWLEADSLLAEVGSALEELHVNFNRLRLRYQQQDEIERVLRASMPTMNAKGILCISF
ncbi:hypothetical protein B0H13DRAFT_2105813 [Mycena leptocephala]|nr:hypothetical protein B0H13DRAFT_2105813 [Mycena leptocephala]